MTITRDWWPAGNEPIDKSQASLLISLAIQIDGLEPPAHLDLSVDTAPPEFAVSLRAMYKIGPKATPDAYRRYCSDLWVRCSHTVRFMYCIVGLERGISYVTRITEVINQRLQHDSKEIRAMWRQVLVCVMTTVAHVGNLRKHALVDALLPVAASMAAKSLRDNEDDIDLAEICIPEKELPRLMRSADAFFGSETIRTMLDNFMQHSSVGDLPDAPVPHTHWTVGKTDKLPGASVEELVNPLYTGVPPYPGVYSVQFWIFLCKVVISDVGLDQFLADLREILHSTYSYHFNELDGGEEDDTDDKNEGTGPPG